MTDFHTTHNLPIPDYALDMHTQRGKRAGKNITDFFEQGAKLAMPDHSPTETEEQLRDELKHHWVEEHDQFKQLQQQAPQLPASHPDRCLPPKDEEPQLFDGLNE